MQTLAPVPTRTNPGKQRRGWTTHLDILLLASYVKNFLHLGLLVWLHSHSAGEDVCWRENKLHLTAKLSRIDPSSAYLGDDNK